MRKWTDFRYISFLINSLSSFHISIITFVIVIHHETDSITFLASLTFFIITKVATNHHFETILLVFCILNANQLILTYFILIDFNLFNSNRWTFFISFFFECNDNLEFRTHWRCNCTYQLIFKITSAWRDNQLESISLAEFGVTLISIW